MKKFEVTDRTLGIRPFILIEIIPDDYKGEGYQYATLAGGGITMGDVPDVLAELMESWDV